jgi:hypothetical protein
LEDNIKTVLKEINEELWSGLIWLRIGTSAGSCEHGNELKVFINSEEIFD